MNNLKILFWNCQGVLRKRLELIHFVHHHKIDILLLNETHLSDKTNFKIPNFHGYFSNRPSVAGRRAAGGTAIFVHRNISHLPQIISTPNLENTTIHIKTSHSELRLVAVYKRPNVPLQTSDLDSLLNTPAHTIIAGDLNSKHTSWFSQNPNSSGNCLSRYADSRTDISVIAPRSPTHYPNNPHHHPDILDIAIMKTGALQYSLENFPSDLSSDHTPIILDLLCNTFHILPPKPLRITDWPKFESLMSEASLPSIDGSSSNNIDQAISILTNILTKNLESCSTVLPPHQTHNKLPRSIMLEINFKRHLRSQWNRFRDPSIKTILNRQISRVKDLLSDLRNSQWTNFLGSLDDREEGMTRFFKLNKQLLRKPPPVHPLKDPSGNLIFDPIRKSEAFADSMEAQFQTPPGDSPLESEVQNTLRKHSSLPRSPSMFFSPGQVWEIIKKLPNRRAPGSDGVPNNALKHCGRKFITHLCHIFNCCTRLNHFPSAWKHAEVVMIPKPGKDVLNPINHRPISLLNTMAKVFERLLLFKLQVHTLHHIRPEQFGFRPKHSTTIQLVKVVDEISNALNRRFKTAAALLDVEKAFDKVWHDGLISKLISFGIPSQLINIIQSFLSARTFQIKIGDTKSSIRSVQAGVPQGSCLSPHLFSLFINDMPKARFCNTALFADDTLFYATAPSHSSAITKLQDQIDLVQPWFEKWKISINGQKTSAILFSNKSPTNISNLMVKNSSIKWSSQIKYLGIIVDRKLSFSKHTNLTLSKAKFVKHSLHSLLNSRSPLNLNLKLHIYKTYIRPIILYAAPAWTSSLNDSSWKKLEAFQAVTLRSISGLPYFVANDTIRNSLKIPTLKDSNDSLIKSVKESISNSQYPHIKEISLRTSTKQRFHPRPIDF